MQFRRSYRSRRGLSLDLLGLPSSESCPNAVPQHLLIVVVVAGSVASENWCASGTKHCRFVADADVPSFHFFSCAFLGRNGELNFFSSFPLNAAAAASAGTAAVQPQTLLVERARRRSPLRRSRLRQTHTRPGFRHSHAAHPWISPSNPLPTIDPVPSFGHRPQSWPACFATRPTSPYLLRQRRTWDRMPSRFSASYGLEVLPRVPCLMRHKRDAFDVSRRRFGLSPGRSDYPPLDKHAATGLRSNPFPASSPDVA